MLSWKRARSEENHNVKSMENPTPNDSKQGFTSFLRISSRVFSGQFFVDACNSLKTVAPLPDDASNLVTPRPPKPTKSLKRWVPNKVGLGVATLKRTDDLVLEPDPEHDNIHKSAKNVVHRSFLLSNDHISSHSSTNCLFEEGNQGNKSVCIPNLGIEGPSDYYKIMSSNKSFFSLPIDPAKGNVNNGEVGCYQEENANEIVTFSIVTSPEDDYFILPPREFMSSCHSCMKKLDHSQDIYIYRGDKSFCSEDCREQEISFDDIKLNKEQRTKPIQGSNQ